MYRLLLSSVMLFLASCNHAYYAPNTAPIPMLQRQGEVRASLLGTSSSLLNLAGGDLQVATALTGRFGVMINGMVLGRTTDFVDSGVTVSREQSRIRYLEGAGGLYLPFGNADQGIFEIYAGYGIGAAKNEYSGGVLSRTQHSKLFIQPSIGIRIPHFETAFAMRVGQVYWKTRSLRLGGGTNTEAEEAHNLINNDPSFIVVEPSLMIRGGRRSVKAQLCLTFSGSRYSDQTLFFENQDPLAERLVLGLGITYQFSR